jgi:drug/metabolite transporter (DMT)-like permease
MAAAVLFLGLVAGLNHGLVETVPHLGGGWWAVVFIGLASGLGNFLWLWALGHTTPTRVTVFLALSPLTAAALGALLLGEALSAATLLGVAGVALGLWLATR